MGYILSSRLSSDQKSEILVTMGRELKKGQETEEILDTLKDKGLTYRRQNMLEDIRRKKASYNVVISKDPETEIESKTYNSLTPTSRRNSQDWFDKVYEPMRKAKGWDSQQMNEFWKRVKTQSYLAGEETEGAELWEIYEALRG